MRLIHTAVGASLAIIGSYTALAASHSVRVDGGRITSSTGSSSGVRSYKGSPYAAPPVRELRWKPPQPVVPWQGTASAEEFRPACFQVPRNPPSSYATPPRTALPAAAMEPHHDRASFTRLCGSPHVEV
jgi:hypothetical protein